MPVRPARHKPSAPDTKRHQPAEIERGNSNARGYGYKWQQARAGYLAKHPLCAECERQGKITVAVDLDHIEPHKLDMDVFWDRGNWQGLCKSCHSAKTAREDGGFGNARNGGGRVDSSE
jgi:5-methylcytosine-specific restriction protein A